MTMNTLQWLISYAENNNYNNGFRFMINLLESNTKVQIYIQCNQFQFYRGVSIFIERLLIGMGNKPFCLILFYGIGTLFSFNLWKLMVFLRLSLTSLLPKYNIFTSKAYVFANFNRNKLNSFGYVKAD